MRKEDDVKRVEDVGGFENVQRPSKIASKCSAGMCGVFSFKCCSKRTLPRVSHVQKKKMLIFSI